jgi:hypothetical protein
MPRKIPTKWVDIATGELTMDALRYLDDLENGEEGTSINTLLAGVNTVTTTTSGIIAGTVAIDPTITGRGSLTDELDATGANIAATATAASAGALAASVSPTYAYGSDVPGSVVSSSVTVTASGGTAPYTYAWTRKTGVGSIVATSATSASTTFSETLVAGQTRENIWTCTVTDAAAATTTVDVPVTLESPSGA